MAYRLRALALFEPVRQDPRRIAATVASARRLIGRLFRRRFVVVGLGGLRRSQPADFNVEGIDAVSIGSVWLRIKRQTARATARPCLVARLRGIL